MNIGIDYTAAIHQQAGIGRYVRDLTYALADLQPDVPFRLFVADGRKIDLPMPPGRCQLHPSALSERNHNRLWHRLRLPVPVETWTGPLDLFHATDFTLPPTRSHTRTVLTIHDLAFERFPHETMPGMHGFLTTAVPRSVQRADHVIAVSEATKVDLIDLYGTPPEKISVVAHGVDPRFRPDHPAEAIAAVRKKYSLPDAPLVLTVGTMQPRKNHRRLVQAFGRIKERAVLVIAGGKGWDYEVVEAEAARLGNRVVFTGFVDDDDLPALYAASAVFAYPALYEGFGLPPLEAMASGVPVLAAKTSSLPEVVGGAGLMVDPIDVGEIAAALDNLLGDAMLRDTLRARGIEHAGQFSWARAAAAMWGIYQKLAKG